MFSFNGDYSAQVTMEKDIDYTETESK